uniref:Uncharacterized protein n=1 Tax=Anguilla anguilla TaxID=7936 RepID=A0A0E9VIR0_ANGAN
MKICRFFFYYLFFFTSVILHWFIRMDLRAPRNNSVLESDPYGKHFSLSTYAVGSLCKPYLLLFCVSSHPTLSLSF